MYNKIPKNKVTNNNFCEETASQISTILKNNWMKK